MDDLRLISRGLYNVLNEEIGTEGIVDMRRRVMALKADPSYSEIQIRRRMGGYNIRWKQVRGVKVRLIRL